MRHEILSLAVTHFYNLCQALKIQEDYSDDRKNHFRGELIKLSEALIKNDFSTLSPAILGGHNIVTQLFSLWAQALDCRNHYTLSHEMRIVMDNLCSKWIDNSDKYIFAATDGPFAIEGFTADWGKFINTINGSYRVGFAHQLYTFKVPKHLHDDFLFIGSLYHEMGHFVDGYYNISDRVAQKMEDRLNAGQDSDVIKNELYPIVNETYDADGKCANETRRRRLLGLQSREYVADLFGTQYLANHISNHIEYVAFGRYDQYDEEHPSPNCRKRLEEAFLNDEKNNILLNDIKDEFNGIGRPLQKRNVIIADAATLMKGQPVKIMNDDELHSLFSLGWDVYLKGPRAFDQEIGNILTPTSKEKFYGIINDAIKNSIANYIK